MTGNIFSGGLRACTVPQHQFTAGYGLYLPPVSFFVFAAVSGDLLPIAVPVSLRNYSGLQLSFLRMVATGFCVIACRGDTGDLLDDLADGVTAWSKSAHVGAYLGRGR